MPIFTRVINVRVDEQDSNTLKITASMENISQDAHHMENFEVSVLITRDIFEIKTIENVVINGLFPCCSDVANTLDKLIGLKITQGYNKKLAEILADYNGCTHMFELFVEIGRCVNQAHHYSILRSEGLKRCIEEYIDKNPKPCMGINYFLT